MTYLGVLGQIEIIDTAMISFDKCSLVIWDSWFSMSSVYFFLNIGCKTVFTEMDICDLSLLFISLSMVVYTAYRVTKMLQKRHASISIKTDEPHINHSTKNMIEVESERIRKHILETSKLYILIIQGLVDEDEKQLKSSRKKVDSLEQTTRCIKEDFFNSFTSMSAVKFESGHYFIQAMDYLGELTSPLKQLSQPVYRHVRNKHKGLSEAQKEDLLLLLEEVTGFFNYLVHIEKEQRFDAVPEMVQRQKYIIELIEELRRKELEYLIAGQGKTRVSILLLECYAESKNLILYTLNLLKAHRDFYNKSKL